MAGGCADDGSDTADGDAARFAPTTSQPELLPPLDIAAAQPAGAGAGTEGEAGEPGSDVASAQSSGRSGLICIGDTCVEMPEDGWPIFPDEVEHPASPESEPHPHPHPEPEPDPGPAPEPEPQPDPGPAPEPEPEPVPEPEPESQPDPGPAPEPEPEPVPEPEPESQPDPGPAPEPEPEPVPEPEPESQPDPGPAPEPEPEPVPEPEPESQPEPEPEPEREPKPEPESDPLTEPEPEPKLKPLPPRPEDMCPEGRTLASYQREDYATWYCQATIPEPVGDPIAWPLEPDTEHPSYQKFRTSWLTHPMDVWVGMVFHNLDTDISGIVTDIVWHDEYNIPRFVVHTCVGEPENFEYAEYAYPEPDGSGQVRMTVDNPIPLGPCVAEGE